MIVSCVICLAMYYSEVIRVDFQKEPLKFYPVFPYITNMASLLLELDFLHS